MITIEHFENGDLSFETEKEFIHFVLMIFMENGDIVEMAHPTTVDECKNYIDKYCDNFKLKT